MRLGRLSLVLASSLAAACGVFGSSDPAPDAPPDRSGENAVPPVSGQPLVGVFVSSSHGDDANDGTADDRPVKTLATAIKLAQARQLRVLACAEEYREPLVVEDGVSLYGDLDCNATPWARKDGAHATVRPTSTPGLLARGIAKPTRIEAVDVFAADGTTSPDGVAGSSVGAFVRDSTNLTFSKSTITAGTGAGATDGQEPPPDGQVQSAGADGSDATAQFFCTNQFVQPCSKVYAHPGAQGGTRTCKVGGDPGPGGQGGDGRVFNLGTKVNDPNVLGGDGLIEAGRAYQATPQTARGGVLSGEAGMPGAKGADGATGVNGKWSFGPDGFVPGDGTPGELGKPGQGGGGAAGQEDWCVNNALPCSPGSPSQPPSSYWLASNGAGGGSGGCAGVPGGAGRGGGASIAALLVRSSVTLDTVVLVAGKAGRGGKGTLGIPGLLGGTGGRASPTTRVGGSGGRGGDPGISGHGAPGPSIALAFSEPAPVRVGVRLVPGEGGAGQPPLTRDPQTIPSTVGQSLEEWKFQLP